MKIDKNISSANFRPCPHSREEGLEIMGKS